MGRRKKKKKKDEQKQDHFTYEQKQDHYNKQLEFDQKDKDDWHTGDDHKNCIAEDCSYSEKFTAGIIYLSPEVYAVIKKLCEDIESEWQMLLKGREDDVTGDIYVDSYYIPKQEVTKSSVKNLDCIDNKFIEENNIVATIHSHADMDVFFSTTDEEFTNMSNIDNHIVVNNKGASIAAVKMKLPCGLVKFFKSQVKVNYTMPEVEIEGIDKIEKYIYSYGTYWNNQKNRYYDNYYDKDKHNKWNNGDDDKKKEIPKRRYLLDDTNSHMYGYAGGYGLY